MSLLSSRAEQRFETMKIVDVKKFGAVGDGVTLDTAAIQKAIDSLEKNDTLLFSDGIFVTGTLALKSDITLLIEGGAEICGSRNIEHYRACGFVHNEMGDTVSLMYALDCENITVKGSGKIQLSGDAFADFNDFVPDCADGKSFTREWEEQTVVAPKRRPSQPIFFNNCRNLHIDGIKIFNSPCWTLVFSNCENVLVENIYVDNHNRIPNNDGIHCSATRNVTVRNSTLLCGDDCFAATCITNWDGVCENIQIYDCLMSSRSAAIRFGHLASTVRNAHVKNVKIYRSNRAFIVFAENGGSVSDISFEGIDAETSIYCGRWWGKGEGFVICADNSDGKIRNITVKDSFFAEENPSVIAGKDGNIENITLDGCRFEYRKGNTHPYCYGKLDLQPNIPELADAPFKAGDTLYIKENGCKGVVIK